MSIDYYSCAKCGDSFPDYGDFTSCDECSNFFCSRKCANFKEVDECVEEDPEEESVEEEDSEEDVEEYQEPKKTCCICRKEVANDYILLYALLRHYKITREEAMKIWRDEKKKMIENKVTFQNRLLPYFSPSDQLDIKLAYCLAKFGHRAQVRKEMLDGKPTRYFEHVRRVAIVLMDEMKIMDRDMIIAALLHDSLEDTRDLTPELLEHCFGSRVVHMVKMLSKVPKEGYIERLGECHEWEILAIKACDRLDNLRSLMIPENPLSFQRKQIEETKTKYFPVFDLMVTLTPPKHHVAVSIARDEIRRLIERFTVMIEMRPELSE